MVNSRNNPFLFHLAPFFDLQRSLGEGVVNTLVESTKPRLTRGHLYQDEDGATWVAHAPGLDASDLELSVEGRTLSLNASIECPEGACSEEDANKGFQQTLRMTFDVDGDAVEASMQYGLLLVRLPKKSSAQSKRIRINKA